MALILGKIKCCFCENKSGVIQSVHHYGIYGEVGKRIFYHDKCLEMIECEPEKFGHLIVDMAIHINDLKERNLKENKELEKEFRRVNETLQRKHFERMIPK